MRSTIICVDDEKMLLNILSEQLTQWFGENYAIEKALSGEEALAIIDECQQEQMDVSVIIADYIMPYMRGDELLALVNEKDARIRKIMLTGYSSIDGIINAINKGRLYRYLTKPWETKDLMLTVMEAIKSYENEKKNMELYKSYEMLYHKYEELFRQNQENFEKTLATFVSAIDERDPRRAGFSRHVAKYATAVGAALAMSEADLKALEYAALLHDVGIIGLNDAQIDSLNKNGMDFSNPTLGIYLKLAEKIIMNMNGAPRLLRGIKYQYERMDGQGIYKLKPEMIPLEGKIIGISHYAVVMKVEMARNRLHDVAPIIAKLESLKGKVFDPLVVDTFVRVIGAT